MAKNKVKKTKIKKVISTNIESNNTWFESLSTPILALIIGVLAFSVYSNSLSHGFTVDDPLVITSNKYVQKGIAALPQIWLSSYLEGYNGVSDAAYRPVSISQFALEKSLFDGKAKMMHFMQLFYWAIAVMLSFLFSYHLFQKNKLLAFLISLLFLAHPIHTEVVNNLKSRDEIILLLGTMGMLYYYVLYLKSQKKIQLAISIIFYFLALFSKETAISFFLLLPLTYLFVKQKSSPSLWKHTALFAGAAVAYFIIRTAIVGSYDIEMTYMNNSLVSKGDFFSRFPDAISLLGKYIWMLLVPYPLGVDYSFNSIPLNGWGSIWPYFSLATIGIIIYAAYRAIKSKTAYAIFIPWFFITIVVASNVFLLIGSTFAERLLLVPSYGFCAIVVLLINKYFKRGLIPIIVAISLLMSVWTWQRNTHWQDDVSLFSRDVKFQPNSARMQTFYGKFIYDQEKENSSGFNEERLKEAEMALQKAIDIAPDYYVSHHYMGFVAKAQEDYPKAAESFKRVLELNESFGTARKQYAVCLLKSGQFEAAQIQYELLAKGGVEDFELIYNRAFTYVETSDFSNAEKYFLEAYSLKPENEAVLSSLIKLYRDHLKDMTSAIKYNDQLKKLQSKKK